MNDRYKHTDTLTFSYTILFPGNLALILRFESVYTHFILLNHNQLSPQYNILVEYRASCEKNQNVRFITHLKHAMDSFVDRIEIEMSNIGEISCFRNFDEIVEIIQYRVHLIRLDQLFIRTNNQNQRDFFMLEPDLFHKRGL